MNQRTLAMMTGFEQYTRTARRTIFLEELEQVVPWPTAIPKATDSLDLLYRPQLIIGSKW
jgi:hypothetical protein